MEQPRRDYRVGDGNYFFTWLKLGGLTFLTFISGMEIYSSKDVEDITFVVVTYSSLMVLFYCLERYKKAPPGSQLRNFLRASIWSFSTVLTLSFAHVVMETAGLTLPMACIVFAIAALTGIGAFSVFFEQDGE